MNTASTRKFVQRALSCFASICALLFSRPVALALLIAALSFVAPGSLWAAAINIDDTNPNETITVSANDFEGGLLLNGILFQQGLGNPATGTFPETGPVTFSGRWITFGQQGPVSRTIFLIETPFDPAGPPPLVSDILQFQIIPDTGSEFATIEGSFVSDINDNLGTLPPGVSPNDVFLETGNPVDLSFIGLSLRVISDVNVPEPSTWVLFAFGLASLIGCRLRRRFMSSNFAEGLSLMNTTTRLPALGLFLTTLISCCVAPGSLKEATAAAVLSDELKISDVGGAAPVPIFDFFIPEPVPPGLEPDLTWVAGAAGPVPIPIPPLTAIGLPGAHIVALLEPAGEPPEPGEVPIPVVLPSGQTAILSDVVISTIGLTSAPTFVSLLSDGHPDLPAIAGVLPGIPGVTYLVETGLLQDITPFAVPPGFALGVQVASDLTVPEPSSICLAGFALVGLATIGCRRRKHCG